MNRQLSLLLILITLVSFNSCRNCKKDMKYLILYNGLENPTTAPDFVIFYATDKSSNITKEICCEGSDLREALLKEHSKMWVNILLKLKPCKESFVFSNEESLRLIRFKEYNINCVDSLEKVIPDSIFEKIRKDTQIKNYDLLMEYAKNYSDWFCFEHLLIRHNIPCYRDCLTGYTITYEIKSGT